MLPHRRPRDRSNPSPLQAPEPRCRTSLGSGGGICSRGRPGIPSRASDLVTMNARAARSDSSLARLLCQLSTNGPLAFLDQVLHNVRHNRRRNHTHPEGRRDRPVEAPATTRNSGQVLRSATAEAAREMRSVAAAAAVRRADTPIAPREDGDSCCPRPGRGRRGWRRRSQYAGWRGSFPDRQVRSRSCGGLTSRRRRRVRGRPRRQRLRQEHLAQARGWSRHRHGG